MRVSSVRPEEDQTVENRFNIGDLFAKRKATLERGRFGGFACGDYFVASPAFREDSQQSPADFDVPIKVQIVDGGDATSVPVRVVDVLDVVRARTRVTSDHRLKQQNRNN